MAFHSMSFPTTQDLLDAALQYAGRGWRVFPVKRDKTPLVKGGFKAATTMPDLIEAWWRKWPMANIGIATGNGLAVLDIDGEEGLKTLQRLIALHGALPRTDTVKTARGWHLYFAAEGLRCSNGNGLDVRAGGGYVIAPPSVHETGFIYAWESTEHDRTH